MRQDFGSITLDLPPGWCDSTEESQPLTLTRPDGVGALQFSVALYDAGQVPRIDADAVASLLNDFASGHDLGPPDDRVRESTPLWLAAATYALDDDALVRAWYVSDGLNVAKITYVCDRALFGPELPDAEAIVRSLQFAAAGGSSDA